MAGRFYEADPSRCSSDADRFCAEPLRYVDRAPQQVHAAIVPHAGWVCSGRIAGGTFRAIESRTKARTFVITGSVHTMPLPQPALDAADLWRTPLGDVLVDTSLREALRKLDGMAVHDEAHQHEHSIEVNLPLMQHVFDDFRIVPCMIPPHAEAVSWGQALGELLSQWHEPVAMICSIDLTHYGPNYAFTPEGLGEHGRTWAHAVNDRRLLELIEQMQAEQIVSETETHRSSCGGGAIAATVAAARVMGATRGVVLEHTDSSYELASIGHDDPNNSVGYAGVVLG